MAIFASSLQATNKTGGFVRSRVGYVTGCANKTDAYLKANEDASKVFPAPEWTDQQAIVMEIDPEHIAEEARKLEAK